MIVVRRAVAGLALALVALLGGVASPVLADTPSPAASATASATAGPSTSSADSTQSAISTDDGDSTDDDADSTQNNSGQVLALAAAGAVAVLAALVVFLRRR